MLPRAVADVPSVETFRVRMDEVLSTLIWLHMSLFITEVGLDGHWGSSSNSSVILQFYGGRNVFEKLHVILISLFKKTLSETDATRVMSEIEINSGIKKITVLQATIALRVHVRVVKAM